MGRVCQSHGVSNSSLFILGAVDHRRDWLPGGGRCSIAREFSEFHRSYPTDNVMMIF